MKSPRADPLVWKNNGFSGCGRFAIQTERVRGEGAYHEVWCRTPEAKAAAERLRIDRGTYDGLRAARRIAQRIANEIHRAETAR